MSQQEPIDDLPPELKAMLDLVREPAPLPPELSDRMLRALDARVIAEAAVPASSGGVKPTARRGPFFRAPVQFLAAMLLGAVLGALAMALLRPPREVVRERVVTRDREVRVPVPVPPTVPPPVPVPVPPPAPSPRVIPEAPARLRARPRDDADDLAAERALLDEARTLLRTDVDGALRLLDAHARRYRHGQLSPERELLRVRALVRAGRRTEAMAVAAAFRRRNPAHTLLSAMDAALR